MPSAQNLPEYWGTYRRSDSGEGVCALAAAAFEWTQHPGHGPGVEFLGDPRTALELGSGEAREAAYLARRGVEVTALDFSAPQVERARDQWAGVPGLALVEAEACAFLTGTEASYDAVYSLWGAVWYTDPDELVPLVARRLSPGGVFAFAQAEPIEGYYGPQAMYGNGVAGTKLTVLRWSYTPDMWADILKRNGLTAIDAFVLPGPVPEAVGTLMVRAQAPEA
ncbi:class I SAM-dependent methyltransferase [Streptomyces pathocidini]|uniref:class I SAM-dependent methyltransferase n=1 Tax=Streptomyces pathocidini TaxID=1650571 RepID=UPI0033CC1724